jgi:energy-coupling factor transporter ATP-binding protein EcfA2
VNLILGKNNAGKTSLLEALAVLSNPKVMLQQLPTLFRPSATDHQRRFYPWLISDGFEGTAKVECLWDENVAQALMTRKNDALIQKGPGHVLAFSSPVLCVYASKTMQSHTCKCVPVRHVEPVDLVRTFSQAVRQRNGEEIMERLLHKVDPRVKKVRVDAAEDGNHVLMDLGLSQMLPLSQAGQGMYRLVSMMAGLIGDRPNLALIDEMDDGIHHSVLADVWTGIAEAADLLGIQVFVTTHSYECIQAAHEAFSKRGNYGLGIIQLFRLKDHVEGLVLQKDQIEAALSGGIDLRN